MNKGDNYAADQNADEKKDTLPHDEHFRSKAVHAADKKHGAYRPRMNAIYGKCK